MTKVLSDLLKPRTVFAFLFYGTFCFLILTEMNIPKELTSVISVLLGFYFGQKSKKGGSNASELPKN